MGRQISFDLDAYWDVQELRCEVIWLQIIYI